MGHPRKFQRVSRLGFVTARHSSSGHQPNFAALNRGRQLYSAGRPSRWSLAHILVITVSFFIISVNICGCAPANDAILDIIAYQSASKSNISRVDVIPSRHRLCIAAVNLNLAPSLRGSYHYTLTILLCQSAVTWCGEVVVCVVPHRCTSSDVFCDQWHCVAVPLASRLVSENLCRSLLCHRSLVVLVVH